MDWYTPPSESAPPPPSKGRAFGSAVIPPVLHIVIQVVVSFIAIIIAFVPVVAGMIEESGVVPRLEPEDILSSPLYTQATMNGMLYSGLVSAAIFYFMFKRRRQRFIPMPPRGPASLLLLVTLIAIAGNFSLIPAIAAIQELFGSSLPTSSLDGLLMDVDPMILLLSVCVAAPLAEELCFRGLAFNHLMRAFPFWKANVIQAAMFGIIHITPIQVAYAFLFGLLLGWIYHRTGRFGAAVLAHIVFNFANFLFGFIPNIESLMEDAPRMLLYIGLPAAAVLIFAIRMLSAATAEEETRT
ncbi:MAG: CPBP family intramembrane metalloprotease [Oscillospiraceae bacterium]|jgi:membrane protease YdiL (CAAX protease family)|nr:CPBP family intramembrane metalloprotease [Oscillospiraceae bacterium]